MAKNNTNKHTKRRLKKSIKNIIYTLLITNSIILYDVLISGFDVLFNVLVGVNVLGLIILFLDNINE